KGGKDRLLSLGGKSLSRTGAPERAEEECPRALHDFPRVDHCHCALAVARAERTARFRQPPRLRLSKVCRAKHFDGCRRNIRATPARRCLPEQHECPSCCRRLAGSDTNQPDRMPDAGAEGLSRHYEVTIGNRSVRTTEGNIRLRHTGGGSPADIHRIA